MIFKTARGMWEITSFYIDSITKEERDIIASNIIPVCDLTTDGIMEELYVSKIILTLTNGEVYRLFGRYGVLSAKDFIMTDGVISYTGVNNTITDILLDQHGSPIYLPDGKTVEHRIKELWKSSLTLKVSDNNKEIEELNELKQQRKKLQKLIKGKIQCDECLEKIDLKGFRSDLLTRSALTSMYRHAIQELGIEDVSLRDSDYFFEDIFSYNGYIASFRGLNE